MQNGRRKSESPPGISPFLREQGDLWLSQTVGVGIAGGHHAKGEPPDSDIDYLLAAPSRERRTRPESCVLLPASPISRSIVLEQLPTTRIRNARYQQPNKYHEPAPHSDSPLPDNQS